MEVKCGGCKKSFGFMLFKQSEAKAREFKAKQKEEAVYNRFRADRLNHDLNPGFSLQEAKLKKQDKERMKRASRASKRENEEEDFDDGAVELATFTINGDCPRCSKIFTSRHKDHLAECGGGSQKKPEKKKPTPAKKAAPKKATPTSQPRKRKVIDDSEDDGSDSYSEAYTSSSYPLP